LIAMRFSIRGGNIPGKYDTPPEYYLATRQLAEKVGFDQTFVGHDLMKQSSWVMLAAIATATKRIMLGPAVVNPFSAHPVEIADAIGALDNVSQGRAILGISPDGGFCKMLNIPHLQPVRRTRESVEIIRRLIRGEQLKYSGKVYSWDDEIFLRFDVENKTLPVYIAANQPRMLELAGEIADGIFHHVWPADSSRRIRPVMEHIRAGALKSGRSVADLDIVASSYFSIAKDQEKARKAARERLAYVNTLDDWPAGHIEEAGFSREKYLANASEIWKAIKSNDYERAVKLVPEELVEKEVYIASTVEECIEFVDNLRKLGFTNVSVGYPIGPDFEYAITTFGKVIKYFKDESE
jgi:5,10-methylenetetrahydromethanopterin reductase